PWEDEHERLVSTSGYPLLNRSLNDEYLLSFLRFSSSCSAQSWSESRGRYWCRWRHGERSSRRYGWRKKRRAYRGFRWSRGYYSWQSGWRDSGRPGRWNCWRLGRR